MKIKHIAIQLFFSLMTLAVFYFFLLPLVIMILNLNDAGLKDGNIPDFTYSWHKKLSKDMAFWANERVNSNKAQQLDQYDISGTEWPMFSAVYFLWATEALQKNWEEKSEKNRLAPNVYAEKPIEIITKLIIDPGNATWVKEHWGADYLNQENIFYRMLLIAGLTSYQELTGNKQYQPILFKQVNSLSNELDASPYGLLDDYPGECYPVDILPALAVIKRADRLLGTDHSIALTRSLRAFSGELIDKTTGLPAYIANSKTGKGQGFSRGVGISYMLIWAPELWPETARDWYLNYEQYFWNDNNIISGFREFSKELTLGNWFFDVDSGPVIAGYGVAASAFGIGAARVNNRFEHAYPLATEAIVASWQLPNGSLLLPRILSNLSDAPYLGEAALLFNMTRTPLMSNITPVPLKLPVFVYICLLFYGLSGLVLLKYSLTPLWRLYRQSKA